MTYCSILIPQEPKKEEQSDVSFIDNLKGKLLSGCNQGGISIENASTVLKNTAKLISDNTDALTAKFSGIALTQLMVNGKISNETAMGYLTQGLPKALGMTSVAQGFQSVEAFKTALKNGNVNVGGVVSSLTSFGDAISSAMGFNDRKKSVEGFDVIEIDVVTDDSRSYESETPDRRVQSGQSYQEYIHNMPDTLSLSCYIQDGRNYSIVDFENIMLNLRAKKTSVNVILGDETKEGYVITSYSPRKGVTNGLEFSLELKKINVGNIELVSLNIPVNKKATTQIVKSKLFTDGKLEDEVSLGSVNPTSDYSEQFKSVFKGMFQ